MKKDNQMIPGSGTPKIKWEPMELKYIDRIKDIILQGGGKLSLSGGDPGENRKQSGGGMQ